MTLKRASASTYVVVCASCCVLDLGDPRSWNWQLRWELLGFILHDFVGEGVQELVPGLKHLCSATSSASRRTRSYQVHDGGAYSGRLFVPNEVYAHLFSIRNFLQRSCIFRLVRWI